MEGYEQTGVKIRMGSKSPADGVGGGRPRLCGHLLVPRERAGIPRIAPRGCGSKPLAHELSAARSWCFLPRGAVVPSLVR